MKKHFAFFCAILLSLSVFVGCKNEKNNSLDCLTYFKQETFVRIYENPYETEQDIKHFVGDEDFLLQRYKYITFNANPKWTYGLTVDKVRFDILCNESQTLDFTITISHIKGGDKYDQTGDFFYFQKSFYVEAIANHPVSVNIEVGEEFTSGQAQIAIVLDSSSIEKSATMKYSIINFELFGAHTPSNY